MQQAIDIAALPEVPGAIVVILCSKWYSDIVDALREKCVAVLHAKGAVTDCHLLPGCFEFPFAANALLRHPDIRLDAIICLGVILKGDTYHFEMIADECVRGLGAVSRAEQVPIINEILPVTDIAHARARAADDDLNKGIEAAAAAIEMIHWCREVGRRDPATVFPGLLV